MVSNALAQWQGARSTNLDTLVAAHNAVTGGRQGRPALTSELNHALLLRLAAEVQGFSRDLHEDAIEVLLQPTLQPNATVAQVMRTNLMHRRTLTEGNAGPGNIGNDFLRLGVQFWPEMNASYPTKGPQWNAWLEWLNGARNGIAHSDPIKIAAAEGKYPLTLATFRKARAAFGWFAKGADSVLGAHLKLMTGTTPW
jgi:hypothetical protein